MIGDFQLRDFGYGVLRIDVGSISLTEGIDNKTGDYNGFSVASDLSHVMFILKLKEFIKNGTK
jgi:hypothetical protein